jgi:hypothetical protein
MARALRIQYDGALYHMTSRGNARKAIYRDDEDRRIFLDILFRYNQKKVADYLGLHYSTISRLINEDNKNISK